MPFCADRIDFTCFSCIQFPPNFHFHFHFKIKCNRTVTTIPHYSRHLYVMFIHFSAVRRQLFLYKKTASKQEAAEDIISLCCVSCSDAVRVKRPAGKACPAWSGTVPASPLSGINGRYPSTPQPIWFATSNASHIAYIILETFLASPNRYSSGTSNSSWRYRESSS